MSHTKGKLEARGYYAVNDLGRAVFDCGPIPMEDEEIKANARRLVACWNALLPFTTEQIEAGIDLVKLVQERDELLAENERLLQSLAGVDFAAAPTPPAQDSVEIPTSADEAELMLKLGWMWLELNAPERLKTPPAQELVELPKLVVYKSTSIPKEQWRNEPIDYWLREMLEECDYHDGLVIKATLAFLEGLKRPAQEVKPVKLHADEIRSIAVNCGFKLREQPNGDMDLNPYVYTFAQELVSHFCISNHLDAHETGNINDKQEVEPVAYLWEETRSEETDEPYERKLSFNLPDTTGYITQSLNRQWGKVTPLYTAPQCDKLRKAAEEAVDLLEKLHELTGCEWSTERRYAENLRAALEGK